MTIFDYLGHGRALELYLSGLKLLIGTAIILTELDRYSPSLADIAWYHSSALIAAPFFVIGGLQLIGWVLNINGIDHNWVWRALGAFLGMFLWSALLLKSSLVGEVTIIIPLALMNLPASSFLLWRAWNRLPLTGARGAR